MRCVALRVIMLVMLRVMVGAACGAMCGAAWCCVVLRGAAWCCVVLLVVPAVTTKKPARGLAALLFRLNLGGRGGTVFICNIIHLAASFEKYENDK